MSQKQGQILIKLIHRQTGITTYDLIKEYKSGWKAFWSNKTARLFNIDLKREYDPMEVPEDYYIETFLNQCFEEGKITKTTCCSSFKFRRSFVKLDSKKQNKSGCRKKAKAKEK